jgi:hypothetical protein
MTLKDQDDIAKLAYALARGLEKPDAMALLAVFARDRDLTEDMAFALYVRGKNLAAAAAIKSVGRVG